MVEYPANGDLVQVRTPQLSLQVRSHNRPRSILNYRDSSSLSWIPW